MALLGKTGAGARNQNPIGWRLTTTTLLGFTSLLSLGNVGVEVVPTVPYSRDSLRQQSNILYSIQIYCLAVHRSYLAC